MYRIRSPKRRPPLFRVPAFLLNAPGIIMFGIEQRNARAAQYGTPEQNVVEGRWANEDIRITAQDPVAHGANYGRVSGEGVIL